MVCTHLLLALLCFACQSPGNPSCPQAPSGAVLLWSVPPDLRPFALSMAEVMQHLAGDIPSPPLLGWLQASVLGAVNSRAFAGLGVGWLNCSAARQMCKQWLPAAVVSLAACPNKDLHAHLAFAEHVWQLAAHHVRLHSAARSQCSTVWRGALLRRQCAPLPRRCSCGGGGRATPSRNHGRKQ